MGNVLNLRENYKNLKNLKKRRAELITFLCFVLITLVCLSGGQTCHWDSQQIPYLGTEYQRQQEIIPSTQDLLWAYGQLSVEEKQKIPSPPLPPPKIPKMISNKSEILEYPLLFQNLNQSQDSHWSEQSQKIVAELKKQNFQGKRNFVISLLGIDVGLMQLQWNFKQKRPIHYHLEVQPHLGGKNVVKLAGLRDFHLSLDSWIHPQTLKPIKFVMKQSDQKKTLWQISLFHDEGEAPFQIRYLYRLKGGNVQVTTSKDYLPRAFQDPLSSLFFWPLTKMGKNTFTMVLKNQLWQTQLKANFLSQKGAIHAELFKLENIQSSQVIDLNYERKFPYFLESFQGKIPLGTIQGKRQEPTGKVKI